MRSWSWAGGAAGLRLPFDEPSLIHLQFQSKVPYYYIALGFALLSTLTIYLMEHSRIGFYFRAIKDDPEASQMIGINIMKFKIIAMMIHGSMTAVIGAFYAQYVLFIDPDSVFAYVVTILTMLAVMIGGLGTIVGPILGVIVMVPLNELTRVYLGGSGRAIDLLIYGSTAIVLGIFRPRGLIGLFRKTSNLINFPQLETILSKYKRRP
jgi:branched-chain amino acid transport system permease protein